MATFGQFYELGPFFSGGNLVAGTKVYHYIAGTNTLLNVYTDRAKTTPSAQPVVADSQGIVSFYGDGIYKLVVADPTNVADPPTIILYTFDNVNLSDISSTVGKGANIASASTLVLGSDGNEFVVTGSVGINLISGAQSQVTLVFSGTPLLVYSGNLLLNNGINVTVAANDVYTFVNEGLSGGNYIWREVSRSLHFPVVGAAGSVLVSRSGATTGLAYSPALGKGIYGLTYDNGTDAVNDLNINVGGAMDATGVYWMQIATAMGKQSDVNWAVGGTVGTPAGALDTGAVGNNDYYIWLIVRLDTDVVDVLYSLSSTAPTMPPNYTLKRLIGWFKRVGGTIVAIHTYETEGGGLELRWDSPTLDIDLSNTLTTARRTDALKVPLNFSVIADVNVDVEDAAGTASIWIYCPDHADLAPSSTVAPLQNAIILNSSHVPVPMRIRTSATGTIAARSTLATVDLYRVVTLGFTWARRN